MSPKTSSVRNHSGNKSTKRKSDNSDEKTNLNITEKRKKGVGPSKSSKSNSVLKRKELPDLSSLEGTSDQKLSNISKKAKLSNASVKSGRPLKTNEKTITLKKTKKAVPSDKSKSEEAINIKSNKTERTVNGVVGKKQVKTTVTKTKKSEEALKNKKVNESKCVIKKSPVGDSSSSESEWEEVAEEVSQDLDDYNPDIPAGGVEITLEGSAMPKRQQKKVFDMMEFIRLQINRDKKDLQLTIHEVHLLCLLARGLQINKILNFDESKAFSLSFLPGELSPVDPKFKTGSDYIKKIVNWFRMSFIVDPNFRTSNDVNECIRHCFRHRKVPSSVEYNMVFIIIARTLNLNVRLCLSLYPLSYKPKDLIKKEKFNIDGPSKCDVKQETEKVNCDQGCSKSTNVQKPKKREKKTKRSNVVKNQKEKSKRIPSRSSAKVKCYTLSSDEDNTKDNDSDYIDVDTSGDDFKETSKRKRNPTKKITEKNRKILSSDSSQESDSESGVECWAEIFSNLDNEWVPVECTHNVYKPYDIEKIAKQPVSYVIAIDSECHVKDVTKRYSSSWMTQTRKLRVAETWWFCTLEPFLPPSTKQSRDEDTKMDSTLLRKPMPSTISEFKDHPLYALKRHLLKFQAIYPANSPTVGFVRGEAVYARECVHCLHSRETWVKEARMVRVGEEPYKIVKARPKWDKMAGVMKTDLPLELFGHWQTEEYMPPIAWNGKVPRNEYGNVELFKSCMLPIGTVHLRNPGLNRIAKKLDIDCSPAVVGFDGHKGSIHPVFDGFVICEEFKDTILAAWEEEQENIRKREEEKRNKRVYGNWKRLIKGLLIRERIRNKYS